MYLVKFDFFPIKDGDLTLKALRKRMSVLQNEVLDFDEQTLIKKAKPCFCTCLIETPITEEISVFLSLVFPGVLL